ncbi:hypothetical protein MICRO8M_50088 [Microbacterium sp. 8M]|nr:hypothetical protein MICRO8M_50088 [Microbacterium sp. 8M]
MWKNGSTARTRSSSFRSIEIVLCATFAMRLRCVSMTPLGRPVVPDEYGSTATCVAGSNDTSGAGRPSASRSRNDGCPSAPSRTMRWSAGRPSCSAAARACGSSGLTVMSQAAEASLSWFAISSAVYSALIVVAVAPARRIPWNTVANAGTFGQSRPTASPTPIPRAARAPAKRSIWPTSWRYVVSAPDIPSMSATRSRSSSDMPPKRYSWMETAGISTSGNVLLTMGSPSISVLAAGSGADAGFLRFSVAHIETESQGGSGSAPVPEPSRSHILPHRTTLLHSLPWIRAHPSRHCL